MKGSRAVSTPSGPPEGNPEGVDLSLTGLPPPLFRRPNSASAAKPIARSVSVVAGSEPRRKALVSAGAPGRGVSGPPTSWGVAGRVASDSWVSAAPRQAPHSCHPAQPCGPVQPCGCPEVRKDRELTHRRAGQSLDPPAHALCPACSTTVRIGLDPEWVGLWGRAEPLAAPEEPAAGSCGLRCPGSLVSGQR